MDSKKINFNSLKNQPSEDGKFGEYGGLFVAETLMPLILSLSKNYNKLKNYIDTNCDYSFFFSPNKIAIKNKVHIQNF